MKINFNGQFCTEILSRWKHYKKKKKRSDSFYLNS